MQAPEPLNTLLTTVAVGHFCTFVLVALRLGGMMTLAPGFAHAAVPLRVRLLLVVAMALTIVPLVHEAAGAAASRIPRTPVELVRAGAAEFALGAVLGLGAMIIVSAFSMAGRLIDLQTGIGLAGAVDPSVGTGGSAVTRMLALCGILVWLLLEPFGGHLLAVSSLIETFEVFPVGEVHLASSVGGLLSDLVHQSLVLTVQIAAPVLAVSALVGLAVGLLGFPVPGAGLLTVGLPLRALACLAVLAMSLSGAARSAADAAIVAMESIGRALTGS